MFLFLFALWVFFRTCRRSRATFDLLFAAVEEPLGRASEALPGRRYVSKLFFLNLMTSFRVKLGQGLEFLCRCAQQARVFASPRGDVAQRN